MSKWTGYFPSCYSLLLHMLTRCASWCAFTLWYKKRERSLFNRPYFDQKKSEKFSRKKNLETGSNKSKIFALSVIPFNRISSGTPDQLGLKWTTNQKLTISFLGTNVYFEFSNNYRILAGTPYQNSRQKGTTMLMFN